MISINESMAEGIREMLNNYTVECFQCGECTVTCPVTSYTGDTINVRRLMRSAQIGLNDYDNLWACATCKLCEESCPRGVKIVDTIVALRAMAFQEHNAPEKIEKVVWDIFENGNPWGGKKSERAKWAEGLGIKNAKEGVDVLLYVGCEAAYDPSQHDSVKSISYILNKAGVNFGILGNDERCCGEPLKNAGEFGFLEELILQNIKDFESTKAKYLVTVSPHCAQMFKKYYGKYGLGMEVMHYAEFFEKLKNDGKINFKKIENGNTVTYHDPCILSRDDRFIDEPREMLKSAGFKIVEMKDHGNFSLCCGGGGNRMFLEFKGKRLSDIRADQAGETNAQIIVTACPYCNMNIRDSVKTKNLNMKVMDLAQLLREMME